ncbi:MAG: glutathione peroxidase [Dehalococcoidia bacterium]
MTDLLQIPLKRLDGSDATLAEYKGSVMLIVNVASKCGLTPQYAGLEQLHTELKAKGLTVLGFPANDFAGQEPGTSDEIAEFCSTTYGVDFPMFEKVAAKGEDQHPVFRTLTQAIPHATEKPGSEFKGRLESYGLGPKNDTDIMWNFEKFVVARDGTIAHRFRPDITPEDPLLREAIEAELAKPS